MVGETQCNAVFVDFGNSDYVTGPEPQRGNSNKPKYEVEFVMKTVFYETFTSRPPLCKKLDLYDARNSPSVRLKVSYYHHFLSKQKLQTTERGFPFVPRIRSAKQFLHSLSCIFFAPIDSSSLFFSHCHSFVKICFTH